MREDASERKHFFGGNQAMIHETPNPLQGFFVGWRSGCRELVNTRRHPSATSTILPKRALAAARDNAGHAFRIYVGVRPQE